MEDVLEVYHRPYDARRPVVCLDEQSKQLIRETRTPIPASPGQPERVDYEYERNGTANLFMAFEPLAGRRRVKVTDRRTKVDFAHVIRELVDDRYPGAEVVVVVMDNLNTHRLSSLYEAFAPDEARRLIGRLEVHHTPKHGSWLNMAETELSVLSRQCLDRRIGEKDELRSEVGLPHYEQQTVSGLGATPCESRRLPDARAAAHVRLRCTPRPAPGHGQ
jgi:hypothetical protein